MSKNITYTPARIELFAPLTYRVLLFCNAAISALNSLIASARSSSGSFEIPKIGSFPDRLSLLMDRFRRALALPWRLSSFFFSTTFPGDAKKAMAARVQAKA